MSKYFRQAFFRHVLFDLAPMKRSLVTALLRHVWPAKLYLALTAYKLPYQGAA